jgi:hypothetical protein
MGIDPRGLAQAIGDAEARLNAVRADKDNAYAERNQCVALIARMVIEAGGMACKTRTAIEGWSEDWHGCVYIDLPTGQVSWHYHDSHAWMFKDLPEIDKKWDGHDTPEKYRRVNAAFASDAAEKP